MKPLRYLLLAIVLLAVALAGIGYWLVGTTGGTRWLLGQLQSRAPAALILGEASGSLLTGIRMDELAWNGDAFRLRAGDVYADIELLPLARRKLVVKSVSAGSFELEVFDKGEPSSDDSTFSVDLPIDIAVHAADLDNVRYVGNGIDRTANRLILAGDLRGPTLRLERVGLRSDWLDLDASGSVELNESFAVEAGGDWRWQELEGTPLSGRLHIDGDRDGFSVQHELAEPVQVSSEGTLATAGGKLHVDLVNSWRSLAWPIPQGVLHSSQGTLRVRGRPDRFNLELDARAGLDDRPEAGLKLDGTAGIRPQVRFDLGYELTKIDAVYARAGLVGTVSSHGRLAGDLQAHGMELTARVDDLQGEVNGNPLQGTASLRYVPDDLFVSGARVRLGDNVATMEGHIGEVLAVDGTVELADLGQLVSGAAGSVNGDISANGPAGRPEIRASLRGNELALGDLAVSTASVDVSGQLFAHSVNIRLRAFDTDIAVGASGGLDQGSWSGQIAQFNVTSDRAGEWASNSTSEVSASPTLVTFTQTCLERIDSAGTACVAGQVATQGDAQLDASIDGVPLAALPFTLPAGVTVAGDVNASLTISRTGEHSRVDAEIGLQNAGFSGVYMDEAIDIALSEARGQANIIDGRLDSSFHVALADGNGDASLTLAIPDVRANQPALDGNGSVSIDDVSLFAIFVPSISRPQGRIEGNLAVSGNIAKPEFLGSIMLEDGAFGVRQTGINITDLNVQISQHEPGQVRMSGSARSGRGTLSVEGYTWVGQDSGLRSEIRLTGENFELARLPDWQVSASPSIQAMFDDHATRITGDLAIPRAHVKMREIPVSAEKASPDAVVHREESVEPTRKRRIDIDVRTSLGDDVRFEGFGLTSQLSGAIAMRGGSHSPYTAHGKLSLINGRYTAYGQELEIERGNLVFNGPLDEPLLDVRAIRKTGDVVAGIQLSGTPSRLHSDVFSDPALSDAEALSYLLTGRPLADSTSTGEGEVLNQAAFALGLSGAGLVASQVRAQLGLETLAIEGTGDDSKLVAGKRLGSRLLVEYGYGLVDKLGSLLLRYQLNDFIVLESRTGTVSNFDIVYRRRKP